MTEPLLAEASGVEEGFDRERALEEIRAGFALPQKTLPPKYFYDHRGSQLFEEITRLEEYYLTRAERALLQAHADAFVASVRPATLVELGAGSAAKTRILLDAMVGRGVGRCYVPVDVSARFLRAVAEDLRREYPSLLVRPAVADISRRFALPQEIPRPAAFAFLGSTIGNFGHAAARRLVQCVSEDMRPGDRFLLGVDLKKDVGTLLAAYNDARGVTAEFNLNVLRVLNAQLGADFDPAAFRHSAVWNPGESRIEMHLVSARDQTVRIPGIGRIDFFRGETIHTENSRKFERGDVEALLASAGLRLRRWITAERPLFALAVAGLVAPDQA
ncbi:MAG TPA: L-histidine N(alpha)-methyltransferase [Longimicrobiales bacterium]|nr:L-histidine N(alpha)-methyltransferase [Longimicrobiales bacterium]